MDDDRMKAHAELAAAKGEVERLREALRPFADDSFHPGLPDSSVAFGGPMVTVGDYRRAARELYKSRGGGCGSQGEVERLNLSRRISNQPRELAELNKGNAALLASLQGEDHLRAKANDELASLRRELEQVKGERDEYARRLTDATEVAAHLKPANVREAAFWCVPPPHFTGNECDRPALDLAIAARNRTVDSVEKIINLMLREHFGELRQQLAEARRALEKIYFRHPKHDRLTDEEYDMIRPLLATPKARP